MCQLTLGGSRHHSGRVAPSWRCLIPVDTALCASRPATRLARPPLAVRAARPLRPRFHQQHLNPEGTAGPRFAVTRTRKPERLLAAPNDPLERARPPGLCGLALVSSHLPPASPSEYTWACEWPRVGRASGRTSGRWAFCGRVRVSL